MLKIRRSTEDDIDDEWIVESDAGLAFFNSKEEVVNYCQSKLAWEKEPIDLEADDWEIFSELEV